MKKKALLVFIFIFWLIGACTFLSMKVEEEMIPQVTAVSPDMGYNWESSPKLPADCIIEDENGQHVYSIYEGTGWEAGVRAAEVQGWFLMEDGISLGSSWGEFVQYSSKPLREGELVEVVRRGEKVEDRWLAVFPEDLTLELDWDHAELPDGVTVEEWNQGAVQLRVEEDTAPFMAGRAKSRVPEIVGATVYSFNDMTKLLENFTPIGLLVGILMAVLVLWVASCLFSREAKRNRWYLCVNLALGLVLLACVPLVLSTIDLPSSLLPRERITDIGTISGAMDQFFGVLRTFDPSGRTALPQSEAGMAMVGLRNEMIARPIVYGFFGALLAALTVLAERIVMYDHRRPRVK